MLWGPLTLDTGATRIERDTCYLKAYTTKFPSCFADFFFLKRDSGHLHLHKIPHTCNLEKARPMKVAEMIFSGNDTRSIELQVPRTTLLCSGKTCNCLQESTSHEVRRVWNVRDTRICPHALSTNRPHSRKPHAFPISDPNQKNTFPSICLQNSKSFSQTWTLRARDNEALLKHVRFPWKFYLPQSGVM